MSTKRGKSRLTQDPIEQLLKQAEKCIDKFEYDVAQQFCQRALDLSPDHLKALELSASLLLEVGECEKARQCLGRVVQLCPDKGHTKYFSLAQIFEGKDSLDCYRKGIEILTKEVEVCSSTESASGTSVESANLRRELSNAYCSVSEIFMTDLCDEPDAEQHCVENIEKAIDIDKTNPEALQCKANYLIVLESKEEARAILLQSLSLWLPKLRAIAEGHTEEFDPVEVCSMPYDSRISCAKLLIELEEYESASEVLEGLVTEDDENVQVWYLLGLMNYMRGDDFHTNARYYLKKGKKVAVKTLSGDPDVLSHMDEMMKELGPGNDSDNDSEVDQENIANNDAEESDGSFIDGDSDDEENVTL